jgi:hypothetical protein
MSTFSSNITQKISTAVNYTNLSTVSGANGGRGAVVLTTASDEYALVKFNFYNTSGVSKSVSLGTSATVVTPGATNAIFEADIDATRSTTHQGIAQGYAGSPHEAIIGPSTTLYWGATDGTVRISVTGVIFKNT